MRKFTGCHQMSSQVGKMTSGHRISQWISASACFTTYRCIRRGWVFVTVLCGRKRSGLKGIFIQNIPLSSPFEALFDANSIDTVHPQHLCHSLLDFVNLCLFKSIIPAFLIRFETYRQKTYLSLFLVVYSIQNSISYIVVLD